MSYASEFEIRFQAWQPVDEGPAYNSMQSSLLLHIGGVYFDISELAPASDRQLPAHSSNA